LATGFCPEKIRPEILDQTCLQTSLQWKRNKVDIPIQVEEAEPQNRSHASHKLSMTTIFTLDALKRSAS